MPIQGGRTYAAKSSRSSARHSSLLVGLGMIVSIALAACGADTAERADNESSRTDRPESTTSGSGGSNVLGTITATVDGTRRTWYVVEGRARTGPYASAAWMAVGEGERMVTLGGFDTRTPPLGTFEHDVEGGYVSFGDYRGSAIMLAFESPDEEAGGFRLDLDDPGAIVTIGYMPVATLDPAGIYMFGPGSVQVSRLSYRNGKARVEGRFEGSLRTAREGEPVRIEDGVFDVSDVPAQEDLQP